MSTVTPEQTSFERSFQPRLDQSVAAAPENGVEAFLSRFPTEDACLEFIKELRWPKGITQCEKCWCQRKHHRVKGRKAYACSRCGNHIYPLRGTVFAKSSTPLQKWFYAMCLMAATKQLVTAKRIQREIRVTYKTAWRMRRRLRVAMDAVERRRPTPAIERILAIRAGADERTHAAGLPEPSAVRPSLLSQEVTCPEGIKFIFDFFPAYLRMCRDV